MGKHILEIQNLTKYYGKIKGVENELFPKKWTVN